jgi:hypothetical protein
VARQCGKTTLAQTVGDPPGYAYLTFDEEVTLAAATADPVGFVGVALEVLQLPHTSFTTRPPIGNARRYPSESAQSAALA